jgi:glyoxylase-like metal-dependent hydrolase (beta-lactamase superfamily II)
MVFCQTGEAVKGLHVLGTNHYRTHLLTGFRPFLFDAGVSCLGPLFLSEIRRILGHQQPICLFLTHVHFDHCGSAALFKKSFPDLKIGASRRAAEILQRPRALQTMAQLNAEVKQWVDQEVPGKTQAIPFEPFSIDMILSEGDRLDMGDGLRVEVLETPGHTWDSLCYYLPEKKWVFTGEAGGIAGSSGVLATEFVSDFDAYLQSLERLARLDVEVVCPGHFQIFVGEDAATFFGRSIQAALKFKARVEEFLDQQHGNVTRVVELIKAEEYDGLPEPKQPLAAYLLNLEARVRHLASRSSV